MRQAFLDYFAPNVSDLLQNEQRLITIKRKDVAEAFVKAGVLEWNIGGGYLLADRSKLEALYPEIVRKEAFYAKKREEIEIFKMQQVADFWEWVDEKKLRNYIYSISNSWDSWLIWLQRDNSNVNQHNLYFSDRIQTVEELGQAHIDLDNLFDLWQYVYRMSAQLQAKRDEQHEEYVNFI